MTEPEELAIGAAVADTPPTVSAATLAGTIKVLKPRTPAITEKKYLLFLLRLLYLSFFL